MALLCEGDRGRVGRTGDSAKESIGDPAEMKQVVRRGQKLRGGSGCRSRRDEVGPIGRNQQAAFIRQDQDEEEAALSTGMTEYGEGSPVERVMLTGDGHLRGEFPEMGSVWRFPSTRYGITSYWRR